MVTYLGGEGGLYGVKLFLFGRGSNARLRGGRHLSHTAGSRICAHNYIMLFYTTKYSLDS